MLVLAQEYMYQMVVIQLFISEINSKIILIFTPAIV